MKEKEAGAVAPKQAMAAETSQAGKMVTKTLLTGVERAKFPGLSCLPPWTTFSNVDVFNSRQPSASNSVLYFRISFLAPRSETYGSVYHSGRGPIPLPTCCH